MISISQGVVRPTRREDLLLLPAEDLDPAMTVAELFADGIEAPEAVTVLREEIA